MSPMSGNSTSSPRSFRTQFGGLFLFLPILASIPLDRILQRGGFPRIGDDPPRLLPCDRSWP